MPLFCFQSLFATKIEDEIKPVVILGGGVGALTSALYLSRAGIEPILIEGANPGGLITQSHSVENWPGELEISGFDLVEKIRSQAKANGAVFRSEEVVHVDFSKNPFIVTTRSIGKPNEVHQIKAQVCIIAMGTRSNYLGVPGETGQHGYWGRGVSNCAVCDGSFYKDKIVGIVGGGDAAVLEGLYLSKIAKKVYVFVRKDSFKAGEAKRLEALLAEPNVEVLYETEVTSIHGDETRLTHVTLKNKEKKEPFVLSLDGLFLAIGSRPNTELFQNILKLDAAGYIQLYKDQESSIQGVFAIGDIVDPVYKQAISAAGDGAKAAIQAQKYLFDHSGLLASNKGNKKKAKPVKTEIAQVQPLALKEEKESSKSKRTSISSGIIEIKSKEQLNLELKQAETPVLIDFYAPWCGPCQNVASRLEDSALYFKGKVKFLKINLDHFYELTQSYQITGMPTVLLFNKNGVEIDRRVGPDAIFDLLKNLEIQLNDPLRNG